MNDAVRTKKCGRCKAYLPLDNFRKDVRYRYERVSWCRKCHIEYQREHRKKHRKQYNAMNSRWAKRQLEKGLCCHCRNKRLPHSNYWCEEHYIRQVAYKRLQNASYDTYKILLNKFNAQNRKCPYTDEPLEFGVNTHLDHILPVNTFPELQCDVNNVEWVSKRANRMKADMTKEEFYNTCKYISDKWMREKYR